MHIPQAKLKSINNKTTERGAHLLLHCRSSPNQLHLFVRGWNIYSVHRVVRQLKICFCLCPFDSVPVCRSPNTDLKEMLKVFRNRSAFLSPPLFIHPPLPTHHLSLQCCRSESVWRRGMYVHTNTGHAVISPLCQHRAPAALRCGFL